jgi:hypothetical protein
VKKGDCGCRNHLGQRKVKHDGKEAALHAILTRHLKHGPHSAYECPKMSGVWHVRSIRRADK